MAELDGLRIATVLTTDTEFKRWIGLSTKRTGHAYKLTYAILIDGFKWILLEDIFLKVFW